MPMNSIQVELQVVKINIGKDEHPITQLDNAITIQIKASPTLSWK